MTSAGASPDSIHDVLIVGAGISGLLAATTLRSHNRSVLLLDKGRGVGGRMATRRFDGAVFDHGAQFFTVRDDRFGEHVSRWRTESVAREWCRGFPTGDAPFRGDGHPRYRGERGMTSVPKHLARSLRVELEERVIELAPGSDHWQLRTERGNRYRGRALLLTAPVPQSLAVIDISPFETPPDLRTRLASVEYDPCLAVLLRLDGPSLLPEPGALRLDPGGPVAWVADNETKGISTHGALTVHTSADFARAHWRSPPEEVVARLRPHFSSWTSGGVSEAQVHRWRHSVPTRLLEERVLGVFQPLPLAFCGDAFGGPRVEGAALSGLAAGDWLESALASGAVPDKR